jgi:hypothetical protein
MISGCWGSCASSPLRFDPAPGSRHLCTMPRAALSLCLTLSGLLAASTPGVSQTVVRASVGATGWSPLVNDYLGGDITLQPTVAPTLSIMVAHPVGQGYRMALEGQFGTSTLEVEDRGVTDDLGTLRTLGLVALLDGPIASTLRWQAGAGALFYRPTVEQGVFLDGGTTRWQLVGALSWQKRVATELDLVAAARYDYSTFTTTHLISLSYSGSTAVHRVGLHIGLERTF